MVLWTIEDGQKCIFKFIKCIERKRVLKNSKYITVEEQVTMFLYVISHNARHRVVGERYQHSIETTSHYFHKVLKAICRLGKELLLLHHLIQFLCKFDLIRSLTRFLRWIHVHWKKNIFNVHNDDQVFSFYFSKW